MPDNQFDDSSATRAFGRLLKVMHRLRGPDGCPWDRQQTPETLTPYLLEEACEAIDAIEQNQDEAICQELGDLLLQVVFQAELFAEAERFDITDICDSIRQKMVRRHPHVFENEAPLSDDLNHQWEQIKAQEKQGKEPCHFTDEIPRQLPALAYATKLAGKARRHGATPPAKPVDTPVETEEDLGALLLAICASADRQGLDPERALRKAIRSWSSLLKGA